MFSSSTCSRTARSRPGTTDFSVAATSCALLSSVRRSFTSGLRCSFLARSLPSRREPASRSTTSPKKSNSAIPRMERMAIVTAANAVEWPDELAVTFARVCWSKGQSVMLFPDTSHQRVPGGSSVIDPWPGRSSPARPARRRRMAWSCNRPRRP